MASVVHPPHIHLDDRGRAWISDTNTKVIEVVMDKLGHGWSPEEIHKQHPHLSMAQIHAAFAYYYDNKPLIDAEIERSYRELEEMRAKATGQATRQELLARLRAKGQPGRASHFMWTTTSRIVALP